MEETRFPRDTAKRRIAEVHWRRAKAEGQRMARSDARWEMAAMVGWGVGIGAAILLLAGAVWMGLDAWDARSKKAALEAEVLHVSTPAATPAPPPVGSCGSSPMTMTIVARPHDELRWQCREPHSHIYVNAGRECLGERK